MTTIIGCSMILLATVSIIKYSFIALKGMNLVIFFQILINAAMVVLGLGIITEREWARKGTFFLYIAYLLMLGVYWITHGLHWRVVIMMAWSVFVIVYLFLPMVRERFR